MLSTWFCYKLLKLPECCEIYFGNITSATIATAFSSTMLLQLGLQVHPKVHGYARADDEQEGARRSIHYVHTMMDHERSD